MCLDRRNVRELGGARGVSGFRAGVVGDDRSNRGHDVQGDVGRTVGEGGEKAAIVTGRTRLKPDMEESNGDRAAPWCWCFLLAGVFPTWSHSRSWGYLPSGGLGVVLLIVLLLVLSGRF